MGKQKPSRKTSFGAYVTVSFILASVLSVLITASMVLIGWNMHRGPELTDADIYFGLAMGAAISLIISALVGTYVASRVVEPVSRISSAAKKIQNGDLSARSDLHGDDDLNQLGETFDNMAESVERDHNLERQLIGDVAHELRTPIQAIQATVEAIQDGVFEADEERLATLAQESRRLGRLVDALLHLNRLENGMLKLKVEDINLSDLVEHLVMGHEALIDSVGLTLRSRVDPDVHIEGDRDLINQAIGNLVSNAVRYTPEGGSIFISLERENGNASVSVTDTGIGIAEEDLKQVFSRFWRADSARATGTGGLGIGLSLVREVADQHRGEVTVESVKGEGSTFTISIPLSEKDPSRVSLSSTSPSLFDMSPSARAARKELDRERKEFKKASKELRKATKEQDRTRKEAEKLAKLQKREEESHTPGAEDIDGRQLTLFGLKVPTSFWGDSKSKEPKGKHSVER